MIDYSTHCKIHQLHFGEKFTPTVIAEQLGLNVKTVTRWLEVKTFRPRQGKGRSSKLDTYKATVRSLLEKHPYSVAQILHILREAGYTGGRTILSDYVLKVRPARPKAYLSLSFAPGECAQVDWGCHGTIAVGNTRRKLHFFVMTLSYSRMLYVEFTLRESMEHFLQCHRNAFEYFGAVPQKIMIDNLKTGVLSHAHGEPAVFNPRYLDLANHYGFRPIACNPRSPHEKGRVENAVGYVKKNFLNGQSFLDFCHVPPLARDWMEKVANIRIHGQTHKKPLELFEKEKSALSPLPIQPYDCSVPKTLRANSQFRITLDSNRYSVPAEYASTLLDVKLLPWKLLVYHQNKLIAEHIRSYAHHQDFENPDHCKALLQERKNAQTHKLLQRFLQLSHQADRFYAEMQTRRLNPQTHLRKIIALSERYPRELMQHAIESACELQAFSSEYIANILEQTNNFRHQESVLHVSTNAELLDIPTPPSRLDIYNL